MMGNIFASFSGSSSRSGANLEVSRYENLRANDQVYILREGKNPQVDVVFFHGLPETENDAAEAYWKVWTKRNDENQCWPVTMLPEDLETRKKKGDAVAYDPRVLAVSWNCNMVLPKEVGNRGTNSYLLVEKLTQNLILNDNVDIGQDRPVILAGHDLGGILIKQFILYVENQAAVTTGDDKEKLTKFLDNLGSIFFYSTPHSGSDAIQKKAESMSMQTKNQMLQFMNVLGKEMGRVNEEFSAYRRDGCNSLKFGTYGLTATHPTYKGYYKGEMVCVEGSARVGIDVFYPVDADHYDVTKPDHLKSNIFTMLSDSIVKVVDKFRESKILDSLRIDLKEIEEHRRYSELRQYQVPGSYAWIRESNQGSSKRHGGVSTEEKAWR